MNESFWDAQGVEIEACAIFDDFPEFQKKYGILQKNGIPENIWNWMLWAETGVCRFPSDMN